MPSAANGKTEKPSSLEAPDNNSPVRQIMTIIDHKIRNLEKRKSKLTSYRDLQKSGKELNADQKVAVAKYDEVAQTLEFARDLAKQVSSIVTTAEKEAKKQAKKEAWMKAAADTNRIRDVLLILDCLIQMGNGLAREDFVAGANGAAKLSEEDIQMLDNLYPEVTPKHLFAEDGSSLFTTQVARAAEHLCAIVDGKTKEFVGTTYAHIKDIVTTVHQCGYFDKSLEHVEEVVEEIHIPEPEQIQRTQPQPNIAQQQSPTEVVPPQHYQPMPADHVPPAPAVVPAPPYPLRPMPPITLQEVEHAYFAQQYAQQRPITEVIGSQNFFFLQESEIDSPVGTPQPPPMHMQGPAPPIPTQTFTNQNFVNRVAPAPGALPMPQPHLSGEPPMHVTQSHLSGEPPMHVTQFVPPPIMVAPPLHAEPAPLVQQRDTTPPQHEPSESPQSNVEESNENTDRHSPERPERRHSRGRQQHGNGDSQRDVQKDGHRGDPKEQRDARFRRYGRGPPRGPPPPSNGYRGRNSFQNGRRENFYRNGDGGDYQNNDREDSNNYQSRERYEGGYAGGFKGGRQQGGSRPGPPRGPPRPARTQHFVRKQPQAAE